MSGRLDELFSPERLRGNWQEDRQPTLEPAEAPSAAAPQPAAPERPLQRLAELEQLISERFQSEAMPVLLAELRRGMERRFPTEGPPPQGEELAALSAKLEQQLARLEDLADALSLPRQGRR